MGMMILRWHYENMVTAEAGSHSRFFARITSFLRTVAHGHKSSRKNTSAVSKTMFHSGTSMSPALSEPFRFLVTGNGFQWCLLASRNSMTPVNKVTRDVINAKTLSVSADIKTPTSTSETRDSQA